jgi:hypothetical protein
MKLFDEIKAKKVKYDERLQVLEAELQAAQAKKAELEKKYAEGLEAEAMGGAAFKNEVSLRKQLDEVNAQISKLPAMIDIVQRGKNQAVADSVPLLRELRTRQKELVEKEWNDELIELKKAKAEYLLRVHALGEIRRKSQKVNSDVLALLEEAEATKNSDYYDGLQSFESLPISPNAAYFGSEKALFMGFDVPSYAVTDSLNNRLPNWIKHYATTGEIKE